MVKVVGGASVGGLNVADNHASKLTNYFECNGTMGNYVVCVRVRCDPPTARCRQSIPVDRYLIVRCIYHFRVYNMNYPIVQLICMIFQSCRRS